MSVRLWGWLDTCLHWSLDWYVNRTLPGWGHLQLWQNNVCNAYEHRVDTRVTPPGAPPIRSERVAKA